MLIVIAGPTGAGKTTLVSALASSSGLSVVHEPSLEAIQAGSRGWVATQRAFLRSRAATLRRLRPPFLMDRHFSEDREIFFRLHLELGHISQADRSKLDAEARDLEDEFPPTFIMCLSADRQVLIERMLLARQPEWLVEGLERQLHLYGEWLARRPHSVILDTTNMNPKDVALHALDRLPRPSTTR